MRAFALAMLAADYRDADAIAPLQRVLGDAQGTPPNERARAALHLAAIELRSGDHAAARAALDAAPGLDGTGRTWAERASSVMAGERKAYRAVLEAPPVMQSASDDDPPEASPIPPPPPAPPAPPPAPAKKLVKKAVATPAKKATPPVAKKPAPPPPGKKPPPKKPAT